MNIKVNFDNFNVKEINKDNKIKILMLKGEKGDSVSADWGTITGTLSEQTDLQAALNLKANESDLEETNNSVANLLDEVNANTTNISNLTDRVSENETDISNLEDATEELDDEVFGNATVSDENTTITLDNTNQGTYKEFTLKGNLTQENEPTPTVPVSVDIVTGDNTITISNSDNTESQVYPISLGTLELYSVGSYSDYLYKSGDDWYKHSEIGKINLGTINWTLYNDTVFYSSSTTIRTTFNYVPVCTHFVGSNSTSVSNRIYFASSNNHLNIYPTEDFISTYNTAALFKQFLTDNNVIMYYPLGTPTDEKITDQTLINQLNTLEKAISYDNQTNITQTNEDLPFNIYVSAYANNINGKFGLIKEANNEIKKDIKWFYVTPLNTSAEIQEMLNTKGAKVIEFEEGNYTFNTTFRLNANTKLILNNSTINFENVHAFYNFLGDDEFLEYNGNGNIEFIGGTIIGGTISLCHAKNIKFINVNFEKCLGNHFIELMALNNVLIKGCKFSGTLDTSDYKEYVQIDECTYLAFPWFNSQDNPTYDLTHNKNICVDGCIFERNSDTDFKFNTGVGMHSYTTDGGYHENITIINSIFTDFDYCGIRLNNVKNVKISNNNFTCTDLTYSGVAIRFGYYAEDVETSNNIFNNGNRALYFSSNPLYYRNFKIINNTIKNFVVGENNSTASIILLNNPIQFFINNNNFFNCERCCINLNGTDIETDDEIPEEYSSDLIICNNLFKSENFYSNAIKIYYGDNVNITNNIFNFNASNSQSAVVFYNADVKPFISNNIFKDTLLSSGKTINMNVNTKYENVYNLRLNIYSGNTQSFTNVDPGVDFKLFNSIDIVIGKTTNTFTVTLKGYFTNRKLSARTYKIPFIDDNNSFQYAILTLNDDGTISGSTSSSNDNIRIIYLYNQLDV